MSYKISDVTPLFFSGKNARKYEHEVNGGSDYLQKFSKADKICIRVVTDGSDCPNVWKNDLISGLRQSVHMDMHTIGSAKVYAATLTLTEGFYTIVVGDLESEPFIVTDDKTILDNTIKIEYTHSSNNTPFDDLFWQPGGEQLPELTFRVEGGFKSGGMQPRLEAETYRTQNQEIRHLYAHPYTVETLTIGDASGVPAYYADFLNKILCLDSVKIDGVPYARNDSATPTLTAVTEGYCRYWITQDLEKVRAGIEGIGGLRQTGTNITSTAIGVSFALNDNIEDKSVLQYDKDLASFKDTNTLE